MVHNPKQEEVIKNINGIYVVDAGAGTGKTYSITKRYLEIIQKENIGTKDILLLTFTNNAAENMKKKIMNKLIETDPSINVLDSNISTFHAFCKQILNQGCEKAPSYLDINYSLNSNFVLSENEILEKNFFRKLYNTFRKNNPEYEAEYKVIRGRYFEILYLIRKLLSKGIFPKKDGWFLDGENVLKGNKEEFMELISTINVPGEGAKGPTQSKYLSKFKSKRSSKLYYDLPEDIEDFKTVKADLIEQAFDEDRNSWIKFIHDIYFRYIEQSIKENRLTFDFLTMFAFLELYHNKDARSKNSFEYVMIDEFQDTNEMQFMLSLLLMKTNNLCVVGDWKQGIYGFRNANIENITEFQEKIHHYKELLNKDETRISFDVDSVKQEFNINFRSSQHILDFSNNALYAKGSADEELNHETLDSNIVKLNANFELNEVSEIKFYETNEKEQEAKFILQKIQELIKSDKKIKEDDSERKITYQDIAVISRTRTFGLQLQELGLKHGIPINFEGGIELFKTKEAILLLAVLRVLANKDDKKGWITLLDHMNYSLGDKRSILWKKEYPSNLVEFRESLFKYKKNILYLISYIFNFFKINNNYSNSIIQNIGSVFSNNVISLENLIYFIEDNIEFDETYNIDINTSDDAVTVQTIHGSKGLEYPIVFIANMNEKQFPSNNSEKDILSFDDLLGIRCTKEYNTKNDYTAIFDNWKTDLVKSAIFTEYDEERRLLFVSITRAKQFVYFTASKPSIFFKELLVRTDHESEKINEINIAESSIEETKEENLIEIDSYQKNPLILSAHDLMTYTPDEHGKGKEFGAMIHNLAERLALGEEVKEDLAEKQLIKTFLTKLNAKELKPEIECALPIGKALVRGIIDLLALFDDHVEIIDYKTDASRLNHEEYIKQLSVYYYAVAEFYGLPVKCKIYYVSQNEVVEIDPITKKDIVKLLQKI
jgi:ATP-dependent helicase/nuclease subunit A